MRDSSWRYYLLAVPAVLAALGIQYVIRKNHPQSAGQETAMTMKPSHYRADSTAGMNDAKGRVPASHGDFNEDHRAAKTQVAAEDKAAPVTKTETAPAKKTGDEETYAAVDDADQPAAEAPTKAEVKTVASAKAPHAAPAESHALTETHTPAEVHAPAVTHAPAETHATAEHHAPAEVHAKAAADTHEAEVAASIPNGCQAVEFRGDGPEHTKVTKAEWTTVMKQFHGAKGDLLKWLHANAKAMSAATTRTMEKQIANLKIQRPPTLEEPDVTWRGIGVWSQDNDGSPILRVGSGFVKLLTKQPARGKFEMARLVAQAWAPCELARVDGGQPWQPLLKCLGVNEDQACATGSYSEGGWAVSSALAVAVAPPGCTVPAFAAASAAGCLKKIQSTTASRTPASAEWQEARR